jgi:hypothetical protein
MRIHIALAVAAAVAVLAPAAAVGDGGSGGGGGTTATATAITVSIAPSTIVGGSVATGTVRLSAAPAAPVVVTLANDAFNPDLVQTPPSVTISPPASSASFPITTFGTTRTWLFHVNAGAPNMSSGSAPFYLVPTAQTDIISITRAELSPDGKLRVELTSTSATAVETPTFAFNGVFTLAPLHNDGGGRYSGNYVLPGQQDGTVTIHSNLGGCGERDVNRPTGTRTC